MMTQNILPFQYEIEKVEKNLTSFGGLPLYMDLACAAGLMKQIKESMQIKLRGWKDEQLISSVILLNVAGGDCLEDLHRLEKDEGLSKLIVRAETHGMRRKERREYERRFRKGKLAFPQWI